MDKRDPIAVLHDRIDSMKGRIWWVVGGLAPFGVVFALWVFSVGQIAAQNEKKIEGTAKKADVAKVQDQQKEQARAINWVGQALQEIADKQDVPLPSRPILREPD